jgi:hypothetical protein
MSGSEVARLLQQISLERQAAQNGLTGLASGIARHDFINAKEERIAALHRELTTIVGKDEATRLVLETYSKQDMLKSEQACHQD